MTSIEEKFEESKRLGLQIVKESEERRLMTLSVGPHTLARVTSDL